MFCLHTCMCTLYPEVRRGSYRQCGPPCGCWKSDLDHLQEQPVLLATEPPSFLGFLSLLTYIPVKRSRHRRVLQHPCGGSLDIQSASTDTCRRPVHMEWDP